MIKLNSKTHGIVDYAVVAFLCLSPTLFKLPAVSSGFTYTLAGIHLLLTVTTEFELGIIKILPLKIHGIIEVIVSFALVGVAFLLAGIEGDAPKRFYLLFAFAVFVTWLLTDYHSYMEEQ